jgi:hypothetical protein
MTEYEQGIRKKMEQSLRCPLCVLTDELEFNMLAELQYEVTHRPEVREAIAEEGGFCEFHFRQFRKIASAKTNALLLIAMVKRFAEPQNHFAINCRLCSHLENYEDRLTKAISQLLIEESFREYYADHSGLCKKHVETIQPLISDETVRGWLEDVHRTRMQKEIPFLEQVATKSYYDTSRLARGSIARTVEKFVGRRAL